ncbi:hypothetical protein VTJ04DRAFT_3592 [Mycothermus thermophilus]|uniref:uncharacterized protein n=1 Tax=Humicola insolens TaxID=85995 RepID=UPI0037439015
MGGQLARRLLHDVTAWTELRRMVVRIPPRKQHASKKRPSHRLRGISAESKSAEAKIPNPASSTKRRQSRGAYSLINLPIFEPTDHS